MTTVQEKAYAKINLGLNVLGERKDGYHEVAMVMQSVGLADDITIQEGEGITITTNLEDYPVVLIIWHIRQLLALLALLV